MALFRRETQEEKRFGGFCVAFYLLILLLGVALGAVFWRERDSQSRNGPRLPEEPCFDYLVAFMFYARLSLPPRIAARFYSLIWS